MATFNKNISETTVSGFLKGKSLKSSTKNFLTKCAKGEINSELLTSFKSCVSAAKSIDTMYAMVGVIILAIKNKNKNEEMRVAFQSAKSEIGRFFRLLYAGNGQKIYSYLNNASAGIWFWAFAQKLLTDAAENMDETDETDKKHKGVVGRVYNKIKSIRKGTPPNLTYKWFKLFDSKVNSIRMSSKATRKLFSKSLENLKGLILAVCSGLEGVLEQPNLRKRDVDSDAQMHEGTILRWLASPNISFTGLKIPASLRNRIIVEICRHDEPKWEKLSVGLSLIAETEKYSLYFRGKSFDDAVKDKSSKEPLVFIVKLLVDEEIVKSDEYDIAAAIFDEFSKRNLLIIPKKTQKRITKNI